jgi:hypothetical protein
MLMLIGAEMRGTDAGVQTLGPMLSIKSELTRG